MQVSVTVEVRREDGTRLTREVHTETQRVYRSSGLTRESRAQTRQRVERMLASALNATMGGQASGRR